jgi:hypothetical protein
LKDNSCNIETLTNIMSRCDPNHWLSEMVIESLLNEWGSGSVSYGYPEVLAELVEMGCAAVMEEAGTTYWRLS